METVGRLDKDTTGLLLLTDDGRLNHRLTSPKKHVPKTYEVCVDADFPPDAPAVFASGTLTLSGRQVLDVWFRAAGAAASGLQNASASFRPSEFLK